MKELTISFEELCDIQDTLKVLGVLADSKITFLQEQNGIGYSLSVSVPVQHKDIMGNFVIDFTDVSKW